MTIVEIKEQSNGSHRNELILHGTLSSVPDGWAVIPETVGNPDNLENFPFGTIEVEEIDRVMTVTKWIAGREPKPFPEIE